MNQKSRRIEKRAANDPPSKPRAVRSRVFKVDFKNGMKNDGRDLVESLELQTHLRQETHRSLAAQEENRLKISHGLQDEVGQTLQGIHVQLLSLKNTARRNPKGLKGGTSRTQRLVAESARSVRRIVRELDPASNGSNRPVKREVPRATHPGSLRPPGPRTEP